MRQINVDQLGISKDSIFVTNGSKEVWLLKSDIKESEKEDGKVISITIPKELATEKGLI